MGARLAALAATTALIAGCSSGSVTLSNLSADERALLESAKLMDSVVEDLDRYGTISASSPGILPAELTKIDDRLAFDLDLTPREIFAYRVRQGASAIRSEREFAAQLKAAIRLAAAGDEAGANAALASALVDADAASDGQASQPAADDGGGSDDGTVKPSGDVAKPPTLPPGPAAGLAVRNPDTLDLSLRDLIKRTFDDHMTLKMFELLSAPKASDFGPGKRLYAAILTVALRPGRDTYRGHIGEIDIAFPYGKKIGGKVSQIREKHPIAYAAFPAVDSQALDLRRSDRSRLALELLVEAVAPKAGGSIGAAYRRLLEQDRATAETRNTLIGFNMNGRNVGWRFTPRFSAQVDPAADNAKAGDRLFEESFPALIFLLADASDLCESVGGPQENQKTSAPQQSSTGGDGATKKADTQESCADHFIMQTTVRWLRAPDPASDRSWLPFSETISRASYQPLSESQALDWALRMDWVYDELSGQKIADGHALRSLKKRYNSLLAATVGLESYFALPVEKPKGVPPALALTQVAPALGWVGSDTYLVASGKGLSTGRFFIGGKEITDIAVQDRTAVLRVDGTLFKATTGPLDVVVRTEAAGSAVLPKAVTFSLTNAKPPTPPKPDARIVVEWDDSGATRRLKSLQTYGSPPAAEVLKAIVGDSKANVNVTLDLKSETTSSATNK